jgi:hypothetical protein
MGAAERPAKVPVDTPGRHRHAAGLLAYEATAVRRQRPILWSFVLLRR